MAPTSSPSCNNNNDDHSAMKDSTGTVISDKINITAKAVAVETDAG
jgi:hypothetical protein